MIYDLIIDLEISGQNSMSEEIVCGLKTCYVRRVELW